MSELQLQGPFKFDRQGVSQALTARLPGVYAFGHTDAEGTFIIEKVGRSDDDVRRPLETSVECYSQFAFQVCASPKAAFENECRLFHNCLDVRSYVHPVGPEGSYWKCPECRILDAPGPHRLGEDA